ncbi:MAG: glycine cleavage system aminomethyltransferase GcvT [Dehalococcoidia bacterium]
MKEPLKKTPLNRVHHQLKARMIDFAGWELPVWYTSVLEEHKTVRSAAGIFDVSDMGRVWVTGRRAGAFLDRILTRSVQTLEPGSSMLNMMCLEDGGILDDLWLFRVEADRYLVVWNAANIREKHDWLSRWSGSDPEITIEDVSADTAMVAVQGPTARELISLHSVVDLPRFGYSRTKIGGIDALVARTGYTGEDGFEMITAAGDGVPLWESFIEQGVRPCGLGARDSLRLEAGMLLCGQDMNSSTNPFEADLGWLVDLDRDDFVGRKALLEIQRQGISRKLIGFQMEGREIARPGHHILKSGQEVGMVTSGGHAPTLGVNIGLGYVPIESSAIGTGIEILIRNRPVPARIVNKRFYRFYKRGV